MTLTMIVAIIAAVLFGVFCVIGVFLVMQYKRDAERGQEKIENLERKLGGMTELIKTRTDMLENRITEQPVYNIYSDVMDVNPHYPYDVPAQGEEGAIDPADFDGGDMEDLLLDSSEENGTEDPMMSAFMDSFKAFEQEVMSAETSAGNTVSAPFAQPGEVQEVTQNADMGLAQPGAPEVTQNVISGLEQPGAAEVRHNIDVEPAVPMEVVQKEITIETVEEEKPEKHRRGYDVGKSGKKYTESELEMLIR